MTDTPRIRDMYHEYLEGRVTFEHLVETATRFLERREAEQAARAAQRTESRGTRPGS